MQEDIVAEGNYRISVLSDYCESNVNVLKIDTLREIIVEQKAQSINFSEGQLLQIVQNVAEGLKLLHSSPIPFVHRNICVNYVK